MSSKTTNDFLSDYFVESAKLAASLSKALSQEGNDPGLSGALDIVAKGSLAMQTALEEAEEIPAAARYSISNIAIAHSAAARTIYSARTGQS